MPETQSTVEEANSNNNFVNSISNDNDNNVSCVQDNVQQPIQEQSAASPLKSAADLMQNSNTEPQLAATTTTTILENAPCTTKTIPAPVVAATRAAIKKKTNGEKTRYYKCASCKTLHESWNFFMHIFEIHQRYICLYCIRLFSTAEKLSVHLEIKHDLEQDHFNSEEALRHDDLGKYLMCCTCQHMFKDEEPFSNHDCSVYMQPCSLCGQMGRHTNNCEAHPDATRRNNNNKIKAKPPPFSNTTQSTNHLNTKEAVTDCDNGVATMESGVYQQMFEQSNEIAYLSQSATTLDYNVPETLLQQQQQLAEQQHMSTDQQAEEAEELGEEEEEEQISEEEEEIAPKLVVPKFKLRVPKEFQKSVDAVITTSEDSENESDSISTGSEEEEAEQKSAQESVLENVDKKDITTDLDLSKSTDDCQNMSIDMDLDYYENNDNNQMFKEEWDKRLKESVNDMKLKSNEQEAEEKEEGIVAETSINGTTHAQWTPTPPASPKSATASSAATMQPNMLHDETVTNEEPAEPKSTTTTNEIEQGSSKTEPLPLDTTTTTTAQIETASTEIAKENEHVVQRLAAVEDVKLSPKIDIETPSEEDALPIQIKLDRALNEYENAVDFIRFCLNYSYPICLYCNHARRIAVNAHSLVTHMLENHRYTPAVNGITAAEELKASSLMDKLKAILPALQDLYINGNNFNSAEEKKIENERIYECFMCRFMTKTHKELYLHNRKMHLRSAVLCFMCRAHFVSFTEVLCHICPGAPHKQQEIDIQYHCCLCSVSNIPSSFRLMVHLRKKHNSCDVCLEDCVDQNRLSSHVWKHKFRHYCYRCNISYRNKNDITNHLYWKHGTESTLCKRCLTKRWRHVYHFCTPSLSFVCETCNECFSKAMYLHVHQRLHANEFKYACETENCVEKFISKRLLLKHVQQVHKPPEAEPAAATAIEKPAEESQAEESDKKSADAEAEKESSHEQKTNAETAEQSEEKKAAVEEDKEAVEAKKKRKQILTFEVLNLSESSDSSEDESTYTSSHTKQANSMQNVDEIAKTAVEAENKTIEATENEQSLIATEKEQNADNVLAIWKNFLNAQAQKDDTLISTAEEMANIKEEPRPAHLHVAYSDHDYCQLHNPNEHKKKERNKEGREQRSATPVTQSLEINASDNEAGGESSSGTDSSDGSGCSCGSNCSCGSSSSNSDSDSSNSGTSDSESSDDSNKSQKKSLNRSKDSNRSPHKKHHRHDSVRTEHHNEENDNNEEAVVAIDMEPTRAPQIFESDLETSDKDSDEDFYAEHPQKEAQEVLMKERASVVTQTSTKSPVNNHINTQIHTNGGADVENEHDEKKERKKLKKKKRDKRLQQLNNNNNNNAVRQLQFESQNTSLNNILLHGQHHALYNSFSNTPVEPALNMDSYNMHMPFAAEQTVITGARSIISEGGGSSSEADGSLKRSKRMRRPNKFYGYTSDDETMSGQSLMIGSRAFKPQPPPQLTWNKDDLPTPSKSLLNQNKPPRSKVAISQNLDDAFGEFAQLINQDNRKRTFGIAAGGKVAADGAFYKRAAKKSRVKPRQVSSTEEEGGYNLPPIPRLKIKPSQIGLNLKSLHEEGTPTAHTSSSSSDSSSEDELDAAQILRPEVNTQAAKTLNVKPHLQLNALATPTAVLQAQQQQQQSQPQLPAVMSTPIPKTTAFNHSIPPALLPNPDFNTLQYFKANNIRYPIRPPAGARQAREGESVYCYCRCPYDEVSEMIACDGDNCVIEWFHFECVGIMMAPQGKWYCAECRPKYITNSLTNLVKQSPF